MIISTDKVKLVFFLEKVGKSVVEISDLLNISRQTVYNLKAEYDRVLGVGDKSNLTKIAEGNRL